MTARTLISAACLAGLCAALALGAIANAGGSTSGPGKAAKTRLTIKSYPRLYGYIKSSHPHRCADGRKVRLFRKLGPGQRPRRDKRIATLRARRVEDVWQWATKGREGVDSGHFYARVVRRGGCAGAFSESVRVRNLPHGGLPPNCPGPGVEMCDIGRIHFDAKMSCPNYYGKASGSCDGLTGDTTIDAFYTCPDYANFHWNPGPGDHRDVALFVDICGSFPRKTKAYIEGYTTQQGGGRFTVTDAHMNDAAGVHWCTPDPPIDTVRSGDMGGPLYLDFQNGVIGADVIFTGFLIRKGSGRC